MAPTTASTTKTVLKDFSLLRFYIILIITVCYFLLQLVMAHLTHSLILQIDAYHMLYNILSIITCIITVKMCQKGSSVKNTFGWTRIHVCGVVSNICFFTALGFSVLVESIQTIVHADHHDSMHDPIWVALVGAIGIFVNAICFITIGGYTFHQSSSLDDNHHEVGDDFVISASVQAYVQQGMRSRRRQSFIATFRDIFGPIFVVLCAGAFYFFDPEKHPHIKYLDPCVTMLTVLILSLLSYRLAKEAGHILLLTIPDHINVKSLLHELKSTFPELHDIHDFHIWRLTSARVIASAHIVLKNTQDYLAMQRNITDFLQSRGISHITLQPEFLQVSSQGSSEGVGKRICFLPCEKDCDEKQCCKSNLDDEKLSVNGPKAPSPPPPLLTPSSVPMETIDSRHSHHSADEAELEPMI